VAFQEPTSQSKIEEQTKRRKEISSDMIGDTCRGDDHTYLKMDATARALRGRFRVTRIHWEFHSVLYWSWVLYWILTYALPLIFASMGDFAVFTYYH